MDGNQFGDVFIGVGRADEAVIGRDVQPVLAIEQPQAGAGSRAFLTTMGKGSASRKMLPTPAGITVRLLHQMAKERSNSKSSADSREDEAASPQSKVDFSVQVTRDGLFRPFVREILPNERFQGPELRLMTSSRIYI
jgi:hypothetical protein